jgi:GNAT superfamily N-acetyltransferase
VHLPCLLVAMHAPLSTLEILQAGPGDVGVVARLFDSYRQFYKKPSDEEAARRFLFARLSKGESILFYALLEGGPVGFVHLYPLFSSLSLARQWILSDLYVITSARKNGVGRALMEHARAFAVDTQANRLILETAMDNIAAQKLYEGLGWKREQDFYTYYLPVKG